MRNFLQSGRKYHPAYSGDDPESQTAVIYAGGGIRLSGGYEVFRQVVDKLGVPVVTYWNSVDVIEDAHPLYVGRGGNMGDRPGNFAVQNADLLLAIGTRISIRQTGYSFTTWAREAKVIMVDIDRAEMKKHTIHVEVPVWADAKDFLETMNECLEKEVKPVFPGEDWRTICQNWKQKYPATLPRHWEERSGCANVFAFIRHLSESLPGKQPDSGFQWCLLRGGTSELCDKKRHPLYH